MGRQVVLRDLNIKGNSDTAYKAPNGKYYSSQEAYEKILTEQKYKSDCIKLMYNLLGYDQFMKLPTIFYKKLAEWEQYSYKVVYICMIKKSPAIDWALSNKDFKNENSKVLYLCAILDNHMVDTYRETKRQEKKVSREVAKNKNEQINSMEIVNPVQQTKNLSRWLEDD